MSFTESSAGEDFSSASSDDWNPDENYEDSEEGIFEKSLRNRNRRQQPAGTDKAKVFQKTITKTSSVKELKDKPKSNDDSDSDSSVDDYLVDPKQLNFTSEFFKTENEKNIPSFEDIEQSILGNTNNTCGNVSEESEAEIVADVDNKTDKQQKLNFKNVHDFTKNLESVKMSIQNYTSEKNCEEKHMNIDELLALGESSKSKSELLDTDSEDLDDDDDAEHDNSSGIKKEGITITINLPNEKRSGKSREDYRLKICRRMNLIKKKNQVYIHKVHVLCWIAHGNYVNRILNYPKLLKSALTLIPSNNCYPPNKTDLKYLEMILKWYIGKMKYVDELKRKDKNVDNLAGVSKLKMKDHATLVQILDAQIKAANAFSRKNLVLIFIILMRALGLQCRLVLSFVTLPLKPNPEDLHSLSKKTTDDNAIKRKLVKDESKNKKMVSKNDSKKQATQSQAKRKVSRSESSNRESMSDDDLKSKKIKQNINKKESNVKSTKKSSDKSDKNIDAKKNMKEKDSKSKQSSSIKNTEDMKSNEKLQKPTKNIQGKVTKKESSASPAITRNAAKKRSRNISPTEIKISQLDGTDDQSPTKRLNIKKIKDLPIKKSTQGNLSKPSTSKVRDVPSAKRTKSKDQQSNSSEKSKMKHKLENDDNSDNDFKPSKKQVKKVDNSPKVEAKVTSPKKKKIDLWVEVYLEAEEKWICVDVASCKVLCVKELYNNATHPVTYIVAWNNDLTLKDVTRRYVPKWNTVTRKLRAEQEWWDATLKPWLGRKNIRDRQEDEELYRSQLEQPLPTSIQEFKNHPIYALKRHLLKFEAIYPPDAPTLGFIRGEPIYARECVHTLHSRDIWLKEAKVVRFGEKPYKIVKSRPKYDKLSGTKLPDAPLEIFGPWQVEDYDPPQAENGIVPRNAYGNVDLFKPCMLPKGTVCLQLPGLLRVARKLQIDCVPAIVGFDFKNGFTVPLYGGFVVCEEFKDTLIAAWDQEEEEAEKKATEKVEKRVYGNWKRLIKALIIREQLKAKYNFADDKIEQNDEKGKSKVKKGTKNQKKK